jgi:hypothetical protein
MERGHKKAQKPGEFPSGRWQATRMNKGQGIQPCLAGKSNL